MAGPGSAGPPAGDTALASDAAAARMLANAASLPLSVLNPAQLNGSGPSGALGPPGTPPFFGFTRQASTAASLHQLEELSRLASYSEANAADGREEEGSDSEGGRSRGGATKRPQMQGRFSGRLALKEDEKRLVEECKLLAPLLGGQGKRSDKSRLTLAKIVRGIACGAVRRHCQEREDRLQSALVRASELEGTVETMQQQMSLILSELELRDKRLMEVDPEFRSARLAQQGAAASLVDLYGSAANLVHSAQASRETLATRLSLMNHQDVNGVALVAAAAAAASDGSGQGQAVAAVDAQVVSGMMMGSAGPAAAALPDQLRFSASGAPPPVSMSGVTSQTQQAGSRGGHNHVRSAPGGTACVSGTATLAPIPTPVPPPTAVAAAAAAAAQLASGAQVSLGGGAPLQSPFCINIPAAGGAGSSIGSMTALLASATQPSSLTSPQPPTLPPISTSTAACNNNTAGIAAPALTSAGGTSAIGMVSSLPPGPTSMATPFRSSAGAPPGGQMLATSPPAPTTLDVPAPTITTSAAGASGGTGAVVAGCPTTHRTSTGSGPAPPIPMLTGGTAAKAVHAEGGPFALAARDPPSVLQPSSEGGQQPAAAASPNPFALAACELSNVMQQQLNSMAPPIKAESTVEEIAAASVAAAAAAAISVAMETAPSNMSALTECPPLPMLALTRQQSIRDKQAAECNVLANVGNSLDGKGMSPRQQHNGKRTASCSAFGDLMPGGAAKRVARDSNTGNPLPEPAPAQPPAAPTLLSQLQGGGGSGGPPVLDLSQPASTPAPAADVSTAVAGSTVVTTGMIKRWSSGDGGAAPLASTAGVLLSSAPAQPSPLTGLNESQPLGVLSQATQAALAGMEQSANLCARDAANVLLQGAAQHRALQDPPGQAMFTLTGSHAEQQLNDSLDNLHQSLQQQQAECDAAAQQQQQALNQQAQAAGAPTGQMAGNLQGTQQNPGSGGATLHHRLSGMLNGNAPSPGLQTRLSQQLGMCPAAPSPPAPSQDQAARQMPPADVAAPPPGTAPAAGLSVLPPIPASADPPGLLSPTSSWLEQMTAAHSNPTPPLVSPMSSWLDSVGLGPDTPAASNTGSAVHMGNVPVLPTSNIPAPGVVPSLNPAAPSPTPGQVVDTLMDGLPPAQPPGQAFLAAGLNNTAAPNSGQAGSNPSPMPGQHSFLPGMASVASSGSFTGSAQQQASQLVLGQGEAGRGMWGVGPPEVPNPARPPTVTDMLRSVSTTNLAGSVAAAGLANMPPATNMSGLPGFMPQQAPAPPAAAALPVSGGLLADLPPVTIPQQNQVGFHPMGHHAPIAPAPQVGLPAAPPVLEDHQQAAAVSLQQEVAQMQAVQHQQQVAAAVQMQAQQQALQVQQQKVVQLEAQQAVQLQVQQQVTAHMQAQLEAQQQQAAQLEAQAESLQAAAAQLMAQAKVTQAQVAQQAVQMHVQQQVAQMHVAQQSMQIQAHLEAQQQKAVQMEAQQHAQAQLYSLSMLQGGGSAPGDGLAFNPTQGLYHVQQLMLPDAPAASTAPGMPGPAPPQPPQQQPDALQLGPGPVPGMVPKPESLFAQGHPSLAGVSMGGAGGVGGPAAGLGAPEPVSLLGCVPIAATSLQDQQQQAHMLAAHMNAQHQQQQQQQQEQQAMLAQLNAQQQQQEQQAQQVMLAAHISAQQQQQQQEQAMLAQLNVQQPAPGLAGGMAGGGLPVMSKVADQPSVFAQQQLLNGLSNAPLVGGGPGGVLGLGQAPGDLLPQMPAGLPGGGPPVMSRNQQLMFMGM